MHFLVLSSFEQVKKINLLILFILILKKKNNKIKQVGDKNFL